MITEAGSLFISVFTQHPKGQLQRKHQQKKETKKAYIQTKTNPGNLSFKQ
jgi:hypothetical protein